MFFLILMLVLLIFFVLIVTSTIKIDIQNLIFQYPKNNINKEKHKTFLNLYILGKIRILKINLSKTKIEEKLEMDIKENRNKFDIELLRLTKKINLIIEKVNLKIDIGMEDAAITAILTGALYIFISILINSFVKKETEYDFNISPIYNKFVINLKLNCIIKIKMIHIINIIYILLQKRRVDKNVRTSNRRSYAYSNE